MHMYACRHLMLRAHHLNGPWRTRGICLGVGGGGRWWRQCGGSGAPRQRLWAEAGGAGGTAAAAADEEEEVFVPTVVLPVMKPPSMCGLRGQLPPLSRQQKQQLIQDQLATDWVSGSETMPRGRLSNIIINAPPTTV